jgi:hypothetical protein
MIIIADDPIDVPQFDKTTSRALRTLRTLDTIFSPIVQNRRKPTVPAALSLYRARRNRFLKRIAQAWTQLTPDSAGSFTALAASLSPWTNWNGTSTTLTAYNAYQVWWLDFFETYCAGTTDPFLWPYHPAPWPLTWRPPVAWSNPTYNFSTLPYTVRLTHPIISGGIGSTALSVYLARPVTRFQNTTPNTGLFCWATQIINYDSTSTSATWELPRIAHVYPYPLPTGATACMIRPQDGQLFVAADGLLWWQAPNALTFRFSHPNPSA